MDCRCDVPVRGGVERVQVLLGASCAAQVAEQEQVPVVAVFVRRLKADEIEQDLDELAHPSVLLIDDGLNPVPLGLLPWLFHVL